MKITSRLLVVMLILLQLVVVTPAFAQTSNATSAQIAELQALVLQLQAQLQSKSRTDSGLTLTGQVISSSQVYTGSLSSQVNDLIVLRWQAGNARDCSLSGPVFPKKGVSPTGITEVRAPQSGTHTYILRCTKDNKPVSTEFKITTEKISSNSNMELMVKHKSATRNKYKAQDIEVAPGSKFDLKWKTKGYEGCWFGSNRYALVGKEDDYKVKLSGTSKGWVASPAGEAVVFTLKCLYTTENGIQEDIRILQVISSGESDKG